MWSRLNKESFLLAPEPSKHGNGGLWNRYIGSGVAELEPAIVVFFKTKLDMNMGSHMHPVHLGKIFFWST